MVVFALQRRTTAQPQFIFPANETHGFGKEETISK
jgi:hypothetical protein